VEQRTEEWYAARLGKVTSSRVADIMARTKSGYSASRENYLYELLCERLTGIPAESYISKAMQWGIDQEQFARGAYEAKTGEFVDLVGFVEHPTIPMFGASPDGMVGLVGLVEIKCPETKKHMHTLTTQSIDSGYKTQMTVQMMCTGRAWCDFISYDPRLPERLSLVIIRFPFCKWLADEIATEVIKFNAELDALYERYK